MAVLLVLCFPPTVHKHVRLIDESKFTGGVSMNGCLPLCLLCIADSCVTLMLMECYYYLLS